MNIIVEVSEEVKSSQYDRVQFLGLISFVDLATVVYVLIDDWYTCYG